MPSCITYVRVHGNARRAMRILLHAFVAHIIPPSKVSIAVANAQDVMSKTKVVNVKSQVTTESINFANEDSEESSKANGSDDSLNDPAWVNPISGGEMGEVLMTMSALVNTFYSHSRSLITPRIPTTFTSVPLTSWSIVRSLRRTASLWRRFTW
jgi:hypothetical protein